MPGEDMAEVKVTVDAPQGAPNDLVSKAKAEWQNIVADAAELRRAVEPMEQFYFMRPDAHPVHGLQDWSTKQWTEQLVAFPDEAKVLADALGVAYDASDLHNVAIAIRLALGQQLAMSKWQAVWDFQQHALNSQQQVDSEAAMWYLPPDLLANMAFERDFPLGVEQRLINDRKQLAITHSGLRRTGHPPNRVISYLIYLVFGGFCLFSVVLIARLVARNDLWELQYTLQNSSDVGIYASIAKRTKDRAQAASLLVSLTFSLSLNSLIDKIAHIDPSTSTVFVGIILGNTWGFVLDNLIGTDEGFREYLWSPTGGMWYAMGTLATGRYGRYTISQIFDMLVSVMLFKSLYPKLVRVAGFTANGREWIANGFVSIVINVITLFCYVQSLRLQYAYPSGTEDVYNQWVSGHVMTIATVGMTMIFLMTETRFRMGQPGINDPNFKIAVALLTFVLIIVLQRSDEMDPSITAAERESRRSGFAADALTDGHLPLAGVCETRAMGTRGFIIFFFLSAGCFAITIFGTSTQSMSALNAEFAAMCGKSKDAAAEAKHADEADHRNLPPTEFASKRNFARNVSPVDAQGRARAPAPPTSASDRFRGKVCLFFGFTITVWLIVLFFTVTPLFAASGQRDMARVRAACDSNCRGSCPW